MSVFVTYTLANDVFYSCFIECKLMNSLPLSLSHTYTHTHSTGLSGEVFEQIRLLAIVELITL